MRLVSWSSPVDEQPADQPTYQPPSDPSPLSLADLKTILEPYCNFFEAAIEAAPAPTVTKVTRLPVSLEGEPEVYGLQVIALPEDGSVPADAPASVKRAYKYFCLCGTACVVLLTALRTELSRRSIPAQSSQAKVEVEVEMIGVLPLAKTALFWEWSNKVTDLHGLLKITLATGEEMVLDLTLGQFGHDPEEWLMPLDDYFSKYTFKDPEGREIWVLDEKEVAVEEETVRGRYKGYWIKVRDDLELSFGNERMRKLFVSMSTKQQKICASYQCSNSRKKT